MSRQGMDTSAVLKLYRSEPNSPQVCACLDPLASLLLSELVFIEVISAANGLVRQGFETQLNADRLIQSFELDASNYTLLPLDRLVLDEAERLLRRYASTISLRPLDAFHIASALVEHRQNPLDSFVTTDNVMSIVARAEGLTVKP